MRGVRGKRGVWPPLGLCTLFQGAVGRVHLPDPVRGTQGQNTPKTAGRYAILLACRLHKVSEDGPKMARLILKQVKGKGPPPYPHFSHRPAIVGRTERKAQLLHKKVGLSAIYRRGQEMQIVPF